MPKDLVKDFYLESSKRDAVRDYLMARLEEIAARKAFNREDTSGIADAVECIEEAFNLMSADFEQVPEVEEMDNPAR